MEISIICPHVAPWALEPRETWFESLSRSRPGAVGLGRLLTAAQHLYPHLAVPITQEAIWMAGGPLWPELPSERPPLPIEVMHAIRRTVRSGLTASPDQQVFPRGGEK